MPSFDRMLPLITILDAEILEEQSTIASRVAFFSLKNLRQQCRVFGLVTGNLYKTSLVAMLKKLPTQPVVYEGFDVEDLVKFTLDRHLELTKSAQCHLTEYESARATFIQAPSTTVALRRSSRLAAQAHHAFNRPSSAKPVKSSAARKVIHKSKAIPLKKAQVSLRAADDICKKSLVQHLEAADRELQFDFLGLPAELRDMVYRMVCISSAIIIQPARQPAIARTCQLLRHEALAVYYGVNRFSVAVEKYVRRSHMKQNAWFQSLQPCHLASVRSFSFTYPDANSVLNIDFDIRGQKFSIVRMSWTSSYHAAQILKAYLAKPGVPTVAYNCLIYHVRATRMGSTLQARFPYSQVSSAFLAAFNASVNKRVGQATKPTAADKPTTRSKEWTLLSDEWQARKGFSASSIKRVAAMLAENMTDVKNLWVGEFQDWE
ncbi:hypothetical protein D6D22_06320 [Aureobasidium pullulans]|uniref:Uncharacterized protein n=2 Tax=Aureobasidium pullulans TaxID=5580 RepID=A0A4S8XHL4_AURPU|nr:hypothetical protein D6D22_06320 [Aureobasidium pullulans]